MPPLRPVHYKVLVSLFEKDGYVFDRQRGDRLIYVKPGVARPLVIPVTLKFPCSSSKPASDRRHEPRSLL